jgi:hypothetical protein
MAGKFSEGINASQQKGFLRFAKFRTVEDVNRFFKNAGFVQVSMIERTVSVL